MRSTVLIQRPRKLSLPKKKPPSCVTMEDSGVCLTRSRSECSSKSSYSFSILDNDCSNSQALIHNDSIGTFSTSSIGDDPKRCTVVQSYKQEYERHQRMLKVLLALETRCEKMEECLTILRDRSLSANFKEVKGIPKLSAVKEIIIDDKELDEESPTAEIQRYISIAQKTLSGVYRIQKQNLRLEKDLGSFNNTLAKIEAESIKVSLEIGEVKKAIMVEGEKEEGESFMISHYLIDQEDLEIPLCVWQKHEKYANRQCGDEGMKEYSVEGALTFDGEWTREFDDEYIIENGHEYNMESRDENTKEDADIELKKSGDEETEDSVDEGTAKVAEGITKESREKYADERGSECTDGDSSLNLHKTEDSTVDILVRFVTLLLDKNNDSKHQENELNYVLARQTSMIRKLDIKRTEEQLRCLDLQSKLNNDSENQRKQESKLIKVDAAKSSREKENEILTDSLVIVEQQLKNIAKETFGLDAEVASMQNNIALFSYSRDLYNAEVLRLKRIQKRKTNKFRNLWRRLRPRDASANV